MPKSHEIEQAKMLRAMANVQFDRAMTEVLGLSNRLGARLMPKQFEAGAARAQRARATHMPQGPPCTRERVVLARLQPWSGW